MTTERHHGPVVRRVADVAVDRSGARLAAIVRQAAHEVLPPEHRVLPDGRATGAALAKRAAELAREQGDNAAGRPFT
jgi:hypothetical protein